MVDQKVDFSAMEAFVAERIIEAGEPITQVVRALAEKFATSPALSLCFALTSLASNLEANFGSQEPSDFPRPLDIYRVVAVVAADALHLELIEARPISAGQLCAYWDARQDRYFASQPSADLTPSP